MNSEDGVAKVVGTTGRPGSWSRLSNEVFIFHTGLQPWVVNLTAVAAMRTASTYNGDMDVTTLVLPGGVTLDVDGTLDEWTERLRQALEAE